MSENEKEKKEENVKGFKTVKNPDTYKNVYKSESSKNKIGFCKSVLIPFVSGVVGCVVVLRHMFWDSIYSQ